ncbi:GNAT family N-acetyltransferase [Gallaecimonas sp. GXIMD4217]|uniref:GNAT family N-acetyltransferase n=1 Tax=Gallaecimonas sp. GXIMD4217 TaxID=3131927 RepID=UPI00311B3A3F
MIKIEKLSEAHVAAVRKIQLADEQVKFAGTAADFLADGSNTTHLHVISENEAVVGFFKLDLAYALNYDFCPGSGIGLRAFAIDKSLQGKGLGTRAVKALFPYLKEHYGAFGSIYLTVNCKNPGAQACYLKGGFQDTGEKYLGGAAGPQYIMRGKIAG